jgi:hypothetical protein
VPAHLELVEDADAARYLIVASTDSLAMKA